MPIELKFFFAIFFVLALAGVAMWLVRRFNAGRVSTGTGRGRMPRLAVIDATAVDGRRRLVLVRRDNVEHLLMIGGPTDIVVEPNILRTTPVGRDNARAPASDPSWLDNEPAELREPEPAPAPRPNRPSLAGDEPRRPPSAMPAPPMPMPERRPEPMTGFAPPEGMSRGAPPMRPPPKPPMPRPPAPPMAAPPVAPPIPSAAAPAGEPISQADQNLAEMAQRLEAALRRPGAEPGAAVAVNPVDRIGAPSVAPEAPPARKPPHVEPPVAAEPAPKAETGFESLEAEMASLLGRPKNPS